MSNDQGAAEPRSGTEAPQPVADRVKQSLVFWATGASPKRLRILVALLTVTVAWYGVYLGTGGGDVLGWTYTVADRLGLTPQPRRALSAPRTPPKAVMVGGYGSRGIRPINPGNLQKLRNDADKGDANALFWMGVIHQYGMGEITRNPAEALRYYMAASAKGQPRAQTNLAILYENGAEAAARNIQEAVRLFRAAAKQGDIVAQYHLGAIYMLGADGVPIDETEAVTFLMPLSDRAEPQSQFLLGYLYLNGRGGLPRDDEKALALFRNAAANGNGSAVLMLSALHAD